MPEQIQETPKRPRDWPLLAEMLRAQWIACAFEVNPYHRGLFEGRAEASKWMAEARPEEREDFLYRMLQETLTNAGEEGVENDDS